jgi:hypothetical protein
MTERPRNVFAVIHTDITGREQILYYASKRKALQAARELPGQTRVVNLKL